MKEFLVIPWEYPDEVNNRYTHMCSIILGYSKDFPPILVKHMGAHYKQSPGLGVCVCLWDGYIPLLEFYFLLIDHWNISDI